MTTSARESLIAALLVEALVSMKRTTEVHGNLRSRDDLIKRIESALREHAVDYAGPEESVECALPGCSNRLRLSDFGARQFCSKAHRDEFARLESWDSQLESIAPNDAKDDDE